MREDLLGLWIGEDGKAVLIERVAAELCTTIRPAIEASPYPPSDNPQASLCTERLATEWYERGAFGGHHRLDSFVVEADSSGFGRTYSLLAAVRNEDADQYEGYEWRPLEADDTADAVRLFSETGPGFVDACVHMEDEGYIAWAEPFTTFRPATAEELAQYRAAHPPKAE